MKEKLETPTCEITKLPLPIRVTEPARDVQPKDWDYHHHFHPRLDPLLLGTAGKALRYSRGQYVPRKLHNRYHVLFGGSVLPEDDKEKFRLCVLSCAGIVPKEAIDVSSKGEYQIVSLSKDEHEDLARPDSVYIERARKFGNKEFYVRRRIGEFFMQYALQQNIRDIVSDRVIDEFLDASSLEQRKKELGNLILQTALGAAIEDVKPSHVAATEHGLVPSTARYTRIRKVVRTFLAPSDLPTYHQAIPKSLQAA